MPLKSIPKGQVRVPSGTIRSTFFPGYSEAGQASLITSSTCSLLRYEPVGLVCEMVGDDIDAFDDVDCGLGMSQTRRKRNKNCLPLTQKDFQTLSTALLHGEQANDLGTVVRNDGSNAIPSRAVITSIRVAVRSGSMAQRSCAFFKWCASLGGPA